MDCLKPRTAFLTLSLRLLLLGAFILEASALEVVNVVDLCGQMLRGEGMIIRSHSASRRFYFVALETDCWLTVQAASPQDRILFQFRFFLVYSLTQAPPSEPPQITSSGLPGRLREDPCTAGSYVQFYDGSKEGPRLGKPLCGLTIPGPVLSTGRSLSLRLVTRGRQPRVDFVGDFTSFRLGTFISPCGLGGYFLCRNKKCIPQSLVCDVWGIDNCGDGSDQTTYPPASCGGQSAVTAATPPSPAFWTSQGSLKPGSNSSESEESRPALQERSATGPLTRTRTFKTLPSNSFVYTACCPVDLPGCLRSDQVTPQGVASEHVGQAGGQESALPGLPLQLGLQGRPT
ncbi:low-density lipoprotein receptor class A domain-containing protein 2 [Gracilinanus agilis]|uniref:low-density lipoprotein receptor class A domain-containing protein 2 n=1 Tax=Gracilinanus agilis TaxID=191870 RepID=UPI001CFCE16D|nr:low-density lipoprotein receptor class A domain-containing protein 2 [Gracilinanus agilis]